MKARLIIILVAVVLLGAIVGVGALRAKQAADQQPIAVLKPAAVHVAPLREIEFEVTESFHGLIEANVRIDMAFQITGRLASLSADPPRILRENDVVKKDEVIATLDAARYQAAVRQAEAQQEQGKAAMAEAEAQVASAEAELDDARKNFTSVKDLFEDGTAKQRELDMAELRVRVAVAMVSRAKAVAQTAIASYDSARAALQLAEVNLDDATLKAPFDGRVAAVPTEIGQIVNPGETVLTLVDLSKVKLVIGVVESMRPLLHVGQQVQVEILALNKAGRLTNNAMNTVRTGTVITVPPAANEISGVFDVEVELDNSDGSIYPGNVGKATVTIGERRGVAVPSEAVVQHGDKMYAYVVGEKYKAGLDLGSIGQTAIDVPASVAREVEIDPVAIEKDNYVLSERPDGFDSLVVQGQHRLSDGQPVRVVPDTPSP